MRQNRLKNVKNHTFRGCCLFFSGKRAVRLRECPLRELRLYCHRSHRSPELHQSRTDVVDWFSMPYPAAIYTYYLVTFDIDAVDLVLRCLDFNDELPPKHKRLVQLLSRRRAFMFNYKLMKKNNTIAWILLPPCCCILTSVNMYGKSLVQLVVSIFLNTEKISVATKHD